MRDRFAGLSGVWGGWTGALLVALLCLATALDAAAAISWDKRAGELAPVPALSARVTDATGTLSDAQRSALEQRLAAAEAKTGNQIAVLIVPSTAPESVEEYSIRVAEQWKLGQQGVDNGVLFLVAKDDRRMRIEVGHGIEGDLPDVVARRILDEVVAPRFRSGDYAGGITAGLERIEQALSGAAPITAPGAKAGPRPSGGPEGMGEGLFQLVVFAIFLLPLIAGVLRSMLGRFFGSLVAGAGIGALAWLITGSLLLGVVGALIGVVLVAASSGVGPGRVGHRRGGGWGSGGSGGGWGGGSTGGWSGGGGTFGGGGASGRW